MPPLYNALPAGVPEQELDPPLAGFCGQAEMTHQRHNCHMLCVDPVEGLELMLGTTLVIPSVVQV